MTDNLEHRAAITTMALASLVTIDEELRLLKARLHILGNSLTEDGIDADEVWITYAAVHHLLFGGRETLRDIASTLPIRGLET